MTVNLRFKYRWVLGIHHVEWEHEEKEEKDAKIVVKEEFKLEEHAKANDKDRRHKHQHDLPQQPSKPISRVHQTHGCHHLSHSILKLKNLQ